MEFGTGFLEGRNLGEEGTDSCDSLGLVEVLEFVGVGVRACDYRDGRKRVKHWKGSEVRGKESKCHYFLAE
jgi:hypothetical protein